MAEPDCSRDHAHPCLDICSTIADTTDVPDQLFEVAAWEVFEYDVYSFVFRGEDGLEFDDVWVGELLEKLQFADGVRTEAIGVFFDDLDLLDSENL